jgi:hypothetical protein
MKARGFTIEQHDAAGQTLWTINNDLIHIGRILYAHLPHTRHPRIFRAIDRARNTLFSLRSQLDDIVAREANRATDLYLRGYRNDAPRFENTPLTGCSPEQFRDLADRLNSLRFSKRKPGRLECREKRIVLEALGQDCLAVQEIMERLEAVKYPLQPVFKTIRAFVELINAAGSSGSCCKEAR